MMYETTFEVIANRHTRFPLDMLRHDCCFPYDSGDASSIGDALDEGRRSEPLGEERRITLIRYHGGKEPRITVGRWSSFGWVVATGSIVTRKVS